MGNWMDIYNLDEVPNNLTGLMRRNIKSWNDKDMSNEVTKSPFTESDFMRSKTDLLTIKYQEKDRTTLSLKLGEKGGLYFLDDCNGGGGGYGGGYKCMWGFLIFIIHL